MGAAVKLIEEHSLKATERGYQVSIRLNWYRSLPISSVDHLQLSLDGQPVDSALLRFGVNGREYRLEELDEQVEEFWFVQDSAIVSVQQPDKVKPGEEHKVEVEIALRFPYIPIGPGKFLTNISKQTAAQVAA